MKNPVFKYPNLEAALDGLGGPVKMMRSSPIGRYTFPVVAPEYSNWKEEQRAWKNSLALSDLSHHMSNVLLSGPDVLRLLKRISCTRLGDFPVNRGKQLIAATADGHFIGDNVAFHTADGVYRFSGPDSITNWIRYHIETGDYDVKYDRDPYNASYGPGDPMVYTYQIQGPHAAQFMREVCDGDFPEIKFFHIGEFSIGGQKVQALRHGMAGVPGYELFGPWSDAAFILEKLEKAGEKYGLRRVGARAYPTTCLESGWVALPLPAIFSGEEMKPYREWLKASNQEVFGSLGGSFYSEDITDYYHTPVGLGYGSFLDVESGCIGADALAADLANPKRKKVTLVWDMEDVAKIMCSSITDTENPAKCLEFPLSTYAMYHYDAVTKGGQTVGVSHYCGVSSNANAFLSIAIVDVEHAAVGTELEVQWGEPNSVRPVVERNVMHSVKVKVAPCPYFSLPNKAS